MGLLGIGQLVTSKAGRDSGRKYVVIGVYDQNHVMVADGTIRKVSRAKRKNIKHLVAHQVFLDPSDLSNNQVRHFIESQTAAENQREGGSTVHGER